jgi:tripartite ATP-independent transporter DctP family solute receptor
MKRRILALLLAATFAAPAALAQTAPIKLRFSHSGTEADSQHLAALEFAKGVKERTNGALTVQVFPNSGLGNDNAALSATRGGTIDIAMSGNPYFTGMVSKLNALDLPYLFDSTQQAYAVLDGPVGRSLLDELGAFNLKGLAFLEVGFRSLANSKRPINTAADIKGLKLRTTPNAAHMKAFQLLGANPQAMPYSEVYQALESHAIDGHENAPQIMAASKMYEVQKYLSLTRHAYTAMPMAMNKARFEGLSPEFQKALLDSAAAAAKFQRDYNNSNEPKLIAELRANGMQVNEKPDTASIRAIVRDETRKLYVEKNGDAVLKAIEAASKQ